MGNQSNTFKEKVSAFFREMSLILLKIFCLVYSGVLEFFRFVFSKIAKFFKFIYSVFAKFFRYLYFLGSKFFRCLHTLGSKIFGSKFFKWVGNISLKFYRHLNVSYIPNKRDNVKQIALKIMFLVCFITLIVSSSYIANYFLEADKQDDIISDSREIWESYTSKVETIQEEEEKKEVLTETIKALAAENSDIKGWIRLSNTKINNPIYQTDNNSFYLNHNQKKQRSVYGALYFDYINTITEEETDKNLIIYGHEMKNGSMFGQLKKLKNLSFYKQNPIIEFSTAYKSSTYKIFSVFILNADKADDNGYIYNIYRQHFTDENDFNTWSGEAAERSIISTNVDVEFGDNIITLVTCSEDFENARLVVMARETREGESSAVDTNQATVNPNPRYPAKWYEKRGLRK